MSATNTLFVVAVVCVAGIESVIHTKWLENNQFYVRRATYSEVIQALFLVDFNLSPEEASSIEDFVLSEKSDHVTKTLSKLKDAVQTIANVKLPEPITPRGSLADAAWLIINYDVMGQILDPKYKPSFFNLFGEHDDKENRLLAVLDERWRVGFSGTGLLSGKAGAKSVRDLEKIMKKESSAERVRQDVFRMYEQLDDIVIRVNNEAQVPIYPIQPSPICPSCR